MRTSILVFLCLTACANKKPSEGLAVDSSSTPTTTATADEKEASNESYDRDVEQEEVGEGQREKREQAAAAPADPAPLAAAAPMTEAEPVPMEAPISGDDAYYPAADAPAKSSTGAGRAARRDNATPAAPPAVGPSGGASGVYPNQQYAQPAPSYLVTPPPPPEEPVLGGILGSRDEFTDYGVNGFTISDQDRLSTFSIDVDTASYSVARRQLQQGALPQFASVRVEEFVNYFDYDYAAPTGKVPFAVHLEAFPDPFRAGRHILKVGVQGKEMAATERPPLHLTFLVDVSGSMSSPDKLGLAQDSLHMLVDTLGEEDTVALATYAGRVAEILPPTRAANKRKIHDAISALESGGSTAMSAGIDLAYGMAQRSFEKGAENRVIILSDGDANVGATSWDQLLSQIKTYADQGVTLSTVGFGQGNYRDTLMEQLANNGDGNNYYIDSRDQAQRVFVEEMAGTIFTIARDVKIQVEFNPEAVRAYRLIGYENRDIADRDFRNDRVDAGEVGSGHNVTALYEVILKEGYDRELATVRLRYEAPGADKAAAEAAFPFSEENLRETAYMASSASRIAYAAGTFAEVLRASPHASEISLAQVIAFAEKARRKGEADDEELIALMRTAQQLGAGGGPNVATR